jgi:hypothetical protein
VNAKLAYTLLTAMMIVAYVAGWWLEPATVLPRIPDTLYCLSWIYITLRSYRDKTSGYPPLLIMYPLVWELLAAVLYISPVGMMSFMKFNYWVWLILSFAMFGMIATWNRAEFTFGRPKLFWPKALVEFVGASSFYVYYASTPGGIEGFFTEVGTFLATYISIHFFVLLVKRPNLDGQSFSGNVLRCFAENGSLAYTLSLHPESLYLKTLLVFTIALDLTYVAVYVKKSRVIARTAPN